MMQEMYRDFLGPCAGSLEMLDEMYDTKEDPFLGLPDDELIGVAYLYPDSLMYMLDVEESLPITDFKGFLAGSIRISVRAWINIVEIAPNYLSVDTECRLDSFTNEKLIMRFFFEGLEDIPARFCTYNRVTFKFFYHNGMYSTPYSSDKSCSPIIGRPIMIEQLITPDFIDFVQRGSIEFEVWGKRPMKLTTANPNLPHPHLASFVEMGDPDIEMHEEQVRVIYRVLSSVTCSLCF